MTWTERFEVGPNCDGWRLDLFLTHCLKRATRAKVARIIKAGVRLESGRRAKPAYIVRAGDVVLVDRVERADPAAPALAEVVVVHESDTLVVVVKPAGMLVHRTAHEATRTLDVYLRARYVGERVEPSHRLDRDTSGLVACGRGLDAIRALTVAFEEGLPQKTYRALVVDPDGRWVAGERRTIDVPLGFDASSGVQLRVGAGTWACRTHVRCLGRQGDRAELSVGIERGRQHQIRAHLFMLGTPIVGDKLYLMGDAFFQAWVETPGDSALAAQLDARWHRLHAERLSLPWEGSPQEFDAGPPPWSLGAALT